MLHAKRRSGRWHASIAVLISGTELIPVMTLDREVEQCGLRICLAAAYGCSSQPLL